jgi:hypothetical protein
MGTKWENAKGSGLGTFRRTAEKKLWAEKSREGMMSGGTEGRKEWRICISMLGFRWGGVGKPWWTGREVRGIENWTWIERRRMVTNNVKLVRTMKDQRARLDKRFLSRHGTSSPLGQFGQDLKVVAWTILEN